MADNENGGLSRDAVKGIALVLMFFGHLFAWTGSYYALPAWQRWIVDACMFAPPVFFFFIAEGWHYTHDRRRYALRIFVFACISQIAHYLYFFAEDGWRTFNVFFDLFLGLLAIAVWESRLRRWQKLGLLLAAEAVTLLLPTDWMLFGIPLILGMHIFRGRPKAHFLWYLTWIVLFQAFQFFAAVKSTQLGILPWVTIRLRHSHPYLRAELLGAVRVLAAQLAAYLLCTKCYRGRKGSCPALGKWLFYLFYPAHYLIILGIKLLCF